MAQNALNQNTDAFVLSWDLDHLGDDDYDASLIPFPGSDEFHALVGGPITPLPKHASFEANFRTLQQTSYPYNNVDWPIMSKEMLSTLLSVGEFRHRTIPITMIDDAVGGSRIQLEREFVGVVVDEKLDIIDWEGSRYERDEYYPDYLVEVQKVVLNVETDDELPPLFRLSAYPGPLLISAAAKQAVKRAGHTGMTFLPLDEFHT